VFSDVLVLTDIPDTDGNCRLRRATPMGDLKFADNSGYKDQNKFVLNVKDGGQLVLEAATIDEKFKWMAAVIGYLFILFSLLSSLYSLLFTLFSLFSSLYSLLFILFSLFSSLYSLLFILLSLFSYLTLFSFYPLLFIHFSSFSPPLRSLL
jgi:hypothetical protein